MLVLTRKLHESIVITTPSGERIVVAISGIKDKRVRIGITAPPTMKVLRTELVGKDAQRHQGK